MVSPSSSLRSKLVAFIENVSMRCAVLFESFDNFAKFHGVTFLGPVKGFLNFAGFFSGICQHYSDFDCIRFVTRFCFCKEPMKLFCEFLPISCHITSKENRLRRFTKTSRHCRSLLHAFMKEGNKFHTYNKNMHLDIM